MTVGERIKEVREKKGMSQVEFATKIKVSKQTLYKYENNIITNIPSDKIEAAAKIGDVSPSYLMGWDDDKLLQQQKTSRKEFSKKWNIQFYEKKMLESFSQLSDDNKKKSIAYTENLLANQKMEDELILLAAHQRTDKVTTPEDLQHDLNIMKNDEEWE